MKTKFDIVLLEKPEGEGLTRSECMDLFDILKGVKGCPIEIGQANGTSFAMGFVAMTAVDRFYSEYTLGQQYIREILNDMRLEHEDGCYTWNGLDIYLSR